ncbi:hypothetical protein MBM_00338 [Drepanopeziza brunnea f. sp. 'multigermtubi' MB_m1]|uniref:Uncharacterized protein n=1 Tax=Marssonina brunnea f. sp. multigermtubi (strain MB_m1) TaxID=1072389 RepID=K1WU91_MARBU|nr:uncharacterized protein MBM_00338 [Drepanopeziza brunnea f. sp. 'multigermtubi' MB_m1]EKD21225.1 hypothetical protein MBM_00338 [Drepanopeziza brunnea f. sp. 'multigermtubi' MB_m1]
MQFTTLFAGLLAFGSFAMAQEMCNHGWSFDQANCVSKTTLDPPLPPKEHWRELTTFQNGMKGRNLYCCDPNGVSSEQFNIPRGNCGDVNGIGWVNCGNPTGGIRAAHRCKTGSSRIIIQ